MPVCYIRVGQQGWQLRVRSLFWSRLYVTCRNSLVSRMERDSPSLVLPVWLLFSAFSLEKNTMVRRQNEIQKEALNSIFIHRLFSLYYFYIPLLLGVLLPLGGAYVCLSFSLYLRDYFPTSVCIYLLPFLSIPSYPCSVEIMSVFYFFQTVSPPS